MTDRPPRKYLKYLTQAISYFLTLWSKRWSLIKFGLAGFCWGIMIVISTPKEYTSTVTLVAESTRNNSYAGLNRLTALVEGRMTELGARDAITPPLYPMVVTSTPFLASLLTIPVPVSESRETILLSEYLNEHQKSPWWSAVLGLPKGILQAAIWLIEGEEVTPPMESDTVNIFHLTNEQNRKIKSLRNRIDIIVDDNSWICEIGATMQDPFVATALTDTIQNRLWRYVTEYRQEKERKNLAYVEQLHQQTKEKYIEAQKQYTSYADRNQGLVSASAIAKLNSLRQEEQMSYKSYTQMTQQLLVAKSKSNEIRPVYALLEPASVPLSPSKPRKIRLPLGYAFLFGLMGCVWFAWGKTKYIQFCELFRKIRSKQ